MSDLTLNGRKRFLCGIGLLVLAVSAQGASFDCGKASTKVEHTICDSPYLSQLDTELGMAYQEALQVKEQADKIRQTHRQWMKGRNACEDSSCVLKAYQLRQKEISAMLEGASGYKRLPRFRVTEGKGYSVCENYARFLNSLPEGEPLPLCHLKRAPDFPDLKDPDWEEMDISSNLELVYSLEKKLSPSAHDRPVNTFEHWKSVYEQQIQKGEAAPRLRRTYLALLPDAPIEAILAYEPDRDSCAKEVQKQGYTYDGSRTSLFVWDEQGRHLADYGKQLAFGVPGELMLYQGKPLLFYPGWGSGTYPRITGLINVYHFISGGIGNQYGSERRCLISFDLPQTLIGRMTK